MVVLTISEAGKLCQVNFQKFISLNTTTPALSITVKLKNPPLCHCKKATLKGHRLDSFVTGPCGPNLGPPQPPHYSIGLTVLFQVTCLSMSSLPLQHQLCQ